MPLLVVDRLEGEFVVVTDGTLHLDLPRAWLPAGVAEGWHLRLDFVREVAAEAERRADLDAQRARLSADDDGGDFSL